ncbi:MAG TPA: L,D-transpeptidase family protein [Flavisolibacter sp.]|nr:L,D-transpeptidase family protein [Flavisolibacter sp.]
MKALKNYNLIACKLLLLLFLITGAFYSCKEKSKDVTQVEIVETPEQINARAEGLIRSTLKEILHDDKDLPDSVKVKNALELQRLYDENQYSPLWSSQGSFNRNGDSLFSLIEHSSKYGLFPDDYYYSKLSSVRLQLSDTSKATKLNASLWAYSDLLFSSAFVQIIKDLKIGRLLSDSIVAKDSVLQPQFFVERLKLFQQREDSVFESLEPKDSGYIKLKLALDEFLPKADLKKYTFIKTKDSSRIPAFIYQRLSEEDSTLSPGTTPDSLQVSAAIKKYQKRKEIKVDGKISSALIERLNNTDKQKFIRIAINLDRYKLLPVMPEQYIFVNIPSYYLRLIQSDTVVLKSRVVVGKPITKTPIITSAINNMITYPKWTIPESIIKKEILPGLKNDPGYTIRKGYSIVDEEGNEIDPYTIKWAKYKTGIPYKVVQGSGDDNALGVLKFNFPNKYAVYLHDTNQRHLFSNKKRALSHGCVRVQAWNELAKFILRNDSLNSKNAIPVDSLDTWLATKQKRYVPVRRPISVFIRYFTCDVSDEGKLVFYEDVYGEDETIREKIFASK